MNVLSLGLMNVKKINRFLWSTKKDAHKKICSFFLPHNVYDISNNWNLQTSQSRTEAKFLLWQTCRL